MKLTILSPERKLVAEAEVQDAVTLTGSEGQIQILPGHAPMIGTLETGIFSYTPVGGTPVTGVISTGFFEVANDSLTLMGEVIELAKEIDLARAKKAQQTAEAALTDAALDEATFKKYQLKLQRALIRQQLASNTAVG